MQIDYDSTTAVGSDNGPETISYATYTSVTGAVAGIVRGLSGTTDVAHANGAKVQAGISAIAISDLATNGGVTKISGELDGTARVLRIEAGYIDMTFSGTEFLDTGTITFGTAFTAVPNIQITPEMTGSNGPAAWGYKTPTVNGSKVYAVGGGADTYRFHWLAIGY